LHGRWLDDEFCDGVPAIETPRHRLRAARGNGAADFLDREAQCKAPPARFPKERQRSGFVMPRTRHRVSG
jgi:hypothetical protein